jgi:hypothetical protein
MFRAKRSKSPLRSSALLGAVAAALVLIPSAASADGDPLLVGNVANSATTNTTLVSSGITGFQVTDTTAGATALFGYVNATTSSGVGVRGESNSSGSAAAGVWGLLDPMTPGAVGAAGVRGTSFSTTGNGPGVYGTHVQNSGTAPGVFGTTNSNTDLGAGVFGENSGTSGLSTGVYGTATNGIGVLGVGGNAGVLGYTPNANGYAGSFVGNVAVTGTLTKGAGAFRIDHPLDPAHSYLQHSFVESPDMKNIYDGNVVTNGEGFATVTLPAYFQALNRDFRYQLTIVGSSFAQAIVAKEIQHNQFTIRTNKPRVKVSWQVTGIRHDAYANAHRIQTVVPKTGADAGKYEHPELYGQPQSKSVTAIAGMPKALPKLKAHALPKQR